MESLSPAFNQIFLDEHVKPGATFSTIAKRFQEEAEAWIAVEQDGHLPPWHTLRTWARDASRGRQLGHPIDLEDRWVNWQRKRLKVCPQGHRITLENRYRHTRRDYRTGGMTTVTTCKTCHVEREKARRATARRHGKTLPKLTMTRDEARALGELLFYRHNRTWLGHRLWMLFLRLAKKEGDDQR